jgi:transposase-like protein
MVSSKYKGGFLLDWKRIKAEYIAGGTSYRKLAEKYGVSFSTLRKVAAKEHWSELRNNVGTKRDIELVETLGVKTAEIDDKYFRLVDKLFDRAEEVIEQTPQWSANMLKEMATAMKYLKECKGVKSEADMREQEARIRNLEKQAEADNESKDVKVEIGSDAEEYSG